MSELDLMQFAGSLDCPSEHLMGNLEGYTGETSTTTIDWRACATKCSTSSSCKAWQFVNSNCMMVESYQRTKAVDGKEWWNFLGAVTDQFPPQLLS